MIKPKYLSGFLAILKQSSFTKNKSLLFVQNKFFIDQSKFYRPRISVENLLNQHQIEFTAGTNGSILRIKYCPFCKKSHNNDPSNLNVLVVNKQNGLYHCHRCKAQGSYLQLKKALLGINVDPIHNEFSPNINEIEQQLISQAQYFIYKQNMKKDDFKDVKEYLYSRGLKDEVINKYNIGCGYQTFTNSEGETIAVKVLYFPMQKFLSQEEQKRRLLRIAQSNETEQQAYTEMAKIKIRGIGKENKKYMRQFPAGTSRGFFGLNTIKKSDKVVVLTEGQFDAMSVNQATGIPALSLPQGANSLPDNIIPYLDQFEKIILWMDNDEAGKMNLDKITQKIGVSRTHIVTNQMKQVKEFKDANDFLLKRPQLIPEMIKKARTLPDQNILQFSLIRDKVKQRILNEKQFEGIQFSNFNFFNKKVKGIRGAELSVISGGTGSGKTTLLSQLSIDLSKKKVPVLWGSFEIRNEILITNMLTQYSELNLKKYKGSFDLIADQFTELPLYYMSFHGSNNVNKVLGTITYAIERYGINFVVIDTLQFLLSGQAEGYKKFDMQDYVMAELRTIATSYNVHIAVVIHPRKTQDSEDVGIHSIYGTSKATQEADNIWVIQNRDGFKIFDIKKNRYDGDVGRVAMGFNKNSKSFFELRKKELQSLFSKQKTVHEILEDRQSEKEETTKNEKWLDLEELSQGDEPQLDRKRKY